MRTCLFILLGIYLLLHLSCLSPASGDDKYISRDTLPLISKSDTSKIEKNNRLIAFVGEKIEVQPLPQESGSMDAGFRAKYKVLLNVYGNYSKNTIEFTAYDHYGQPGFSNYKNVLLFVSEHKGKYYHEKYQYFDVYKTKNGRWASPYKSEDYNHAYNTYTPIKPEIIEFAETVAYPVRIKWHDGTDVTLSYPSSFYKMKGDSAIAIYGNYLEDLFALKKSGVLAARELFDVTPEQEEAMVLWTAFPEEKKIPPNADDLKFMAFWKVFAASVKEPGLKEFKRIALDSLRICDLLLGTSNFIDKCFWEVFDDEVIKRISKSTGKQYTWSDADFSYLHSNARKEIVKVRNNYRFRQVLVKRSTSNNSPPEIRFDFIETKKGYRLYGIDHHWFKECCQ
jgi:hypothetical protein